jgi:hypothetical protein
VPSLSFGTVSTMSWTRKSSASLLNCFAEFARAAIQAWSGEAFARVADKACTDWMTTERSPTAEATRLQTHADVSRPAWLPAEIARDRCGFVLTGDPLHMSWFG